MTYYQEQYEPGSRSFVDGSVTWAVQRLIVLNVIIFAAQLVLGVRFGHSSISNNVAISGGAVVDWLCFQPSRFLAGHVYEVLSYQFLHNGLMHIFSNMLCLFFFGPEVERALGTRRFYGFFLACGAIGVLTTLAPYILSGGMSNAPVAGASGSVLGVLVAFAVLDPERRVYVFPFPFALNARGLVIFFIVMQVFYALSGGISVATHLGGMAAGFALIKGIPMYTAWQTSRRREKVSKPKRGKDSIGDAVDNIFNFEDKKKR